MKYCRYLSVLVLVALPLAGCKDGKDAKEESSYGPAVEQFLPAGFEQLVLGVSTESEVLAMIGSPHRRDADHSLGGSMGVSRNGNPAINLVYMSGPQLKQRLIKDGVAGTVIESRLANDTLLPDREPFSRYGEIDLSLIKYGDAEPVLAWVTVYGDAGSLCDNLGEKLADEPQASKCPGNNRKLGETGKGWSYCAGNRDGTQNVMIECRSRDGLDELGFSLHAK